MNCQSLVRTAVLCASLCTSETLLAGENGWDPSKIESIIGIKGTFNEKENSVKISRPRNDVAVTVDHVSMAPFMGLTSWATFMPGGQADAMVMGDIVLFEDEVNSVMSAALARGLTVTALHNHFFFDRPKVYFMHIGGEGTVENLAEGVRTIFDTVDKIRTATSGSNF